VGGLLVSVAAAAVLALTCAPPARAVPAAPDATTELHQPSGATFTARLVGDEWQSDYETAAGYTIMRDRQTRYWRYAVEDGARGQLQASGPRVGVGAPFGIDRHLRDPAEGDVQRPAMDLGSPDPPNTGTHHSLIILAQFADQDSRGTTTAAQWAGRFFGASGSVDDYYNEVSYGQLRFAPATETYGTQNDGVVGWVTMEYDHPVPEWESSPDPYGASSRIVEDAIDAADAYVDYSDYDTRAPFGTITADELHVTVVAAGGEAATGCAGDGGEIWAHMSSTSTTPTVDGVEVGGGDGGSYTILGEIQCNGGNHMATLGTVVHELGHDLDMPDLYDVDDTSTGGVGTWSVMALGSWNSVFPDYQGASPAHPDAFLKYYEGWTGPTAISGSQRVSLDDAESSRDAVRLGPNPGGVDWTFWSQVGSGEYFLAENRQLTGYDAGLPGCGILIYHVDETRSANSEDARRLVDLEEADGGEDYWGGPGDPFLSGSFDDSSTPDSRYYSGNESGVAAANFSGACAPTMAADFLYESPPAPANDDFVAAQLLSGIAASRDDDTNTGATKEDAAGEPDHAGNDGGASIWYRWTAPESSSVIVDTIGSDFDTTLAAYTGSTVGGLSEVDGNDDISAGQAQSRINFAASAGITYRIAVDGNNDGFGPATGTVDLHLSTTVADTDPPETAITAGPSGTVHDPSPSFSFSSDEEGSSFQCRLDVAAFAPCGSPRRFSNLPDGPHTFEVRAADQAGNTDPTPASRSFTLAKTIPDTVVDGAAHAKRRQRQRGGKIEVRATACATGAEPVAVEGSGRVKVGKRSYRLRPAEAKVTPGTCKNVKLVSRRHQARRIHQALDRGRSATASVVLELADRSGNTEIENLAVTLRRSGARPGHRP
jgi:M6 family metalloprotease-like protein